MPRALCCRSPLALLLPSGALARCPCAPANCACWGNLILHPPSQHGIPCCCLLQSLHSHRLTLRLPHMVADSSPFLGCVGRVFGGAAKLGCQSWSQKFCVGNSRPCNSWRFTPFDLPPGPPTRVGSLDSDSYTEPRREVCVVVRKLHRSWQNLFSYLIVSRKLSKSRTTRPKQRSRWQGCQ